MEMRGLMGGFYRISEWIMRFSVTNLLWIVCSAPFFLLSLGLLGIGQEDASDQLKTMLIMMAVVAPFTFFPSTAAMFGMVRKWVMGEEDAPLFKTFFRSFKQNFLQSMLSGIIFTLLFTIIVVNYQFYLNLNNNYNVLSVFFIVFFIILMISLFNFFCVLSHMHMSTLALIKNAILITIGRPFTSLSIVLTNFAIMYISFFHFNLFLVFFFMGSMVAYMTFFYFYRMFLKIQAKQQELEEAEAKEV
jgi:uncharacterized membrane protein YesL